jgi:hypothetical protein
MVPHPTPGGRRAFYRVMTGFTEKVLRNCLRLPIETS